MLNIRETAMTHGAPLLLFSAETFQSRYRELQQALPGVKHHYALKALPYEGCIRAIQPCNGYLDVASVGEMELVKATAPEMMHRCIYTHPIKTRSDIQKALDYGIEVMVADNVNELEKFLPFAGQAKLLLRIAFPNPDARCDLSSKFGAKPLEIKRLLAYCTTNKLHVLGCSFHVGSQMAHPDAHLRAIRAARELYDWSRRSLGLKWQVLNIGGGFPAQLDPSIPGISEFCSPIHQLLQELFPNVEIWSEPGRCIATDSMAALSQVIGKTFKDRRFWYYLNDGVYHTFSGKLYDHASYHHEPFQVCHTGELFESVLAGPTCDSIDILDENALLPEMQIGDLFITQQVGAYGWASRSGFNHLQPSTILDVAGSFDRSVPGPDLYAKDKYCIEGAIWSPGVAGAPPESCKENAFAL